MGLKGLNCLKSPKITRSFRFQNRPAPGRNEEATLATLEIGLLIQAECLKNTLLYSDLKQIMYGSSFANGVPYQMLYGPSSFANDAPSEVYMNLFPQMTFCITAAM